MNDQQKKKQLKTYKTFATGLLVLMAVIFIWTTHLEKTNSSHWIGYVRAFSEAAMVGALADWFAVTALFHYPLGIKIPHTNLIQNKKEQIGDNLGNFVVKNFLSPENIRPYLQKIKVSQSLGEWLSSSKNQEILIHQAVSLLKDILYKLDDQSVIHFISKKAKEMAKDLKINTIVGNGLDYILDKNDHQRLITGLSKQMKDYILSHQEIIKERVKKESYTLIPKFVDDAIAAKITNGLSNFFEEIETNEDHSMRKEITKKLYDFSKDLKENKKWEKEFSTIKDHFLQEDKLKLYATDLWNSIKKTLIDELSQESSPLKNYLKKNLKELSINLKTDAQLQYKIDHWVRVTAYKYILKNTHQFGELISSTVGNWEGKELSDKLELEVGRDLQFIRVNGTIVGGLVGLVLHAISQFLL